MSDPTVLGFKVVAVENMPISEVMIAMELTPEWEIGDATIRYIRRFKRLGTIIGASTESEGEG